MRELRQASAGARCFNAASQQRVGKLGVVDRARQHQCTDHRGHGNERMLVRTRLPPRRATGGQRDRSFP